MYSARDLHAEGVSKSSVHSPKLKENCPEVSDSKQVTHAHNTKTELQAHKDSEKDEEEEGLALGSINLSSRNVNVLRLLGREDFNTAMRRIMRYVGRYPPLETFPILDGPNLRPYHRFSDPQLYDRDLLYLVRPNYLGDKNRVVGSVAFFAELDRLVGLLDEREVDNLLPITAQRHPYLIQIHPYMNHRAALSRFSDVVFLYQDVMNQVSPVYNAWLRELRVLVKCILYVIGRMDQAASFGDLAVFIKCLDLLNNITTSFRALAEMDYALREDAYKACN